MYAAYPGLMQQAGGGVPAQQPPLAGPSAATAYPPQQHPAAAAGSYPRHPVTGQMLPPQPAPFTNWGAPGQAYPYGWTQGPVPNGPPYPGMPPPGPVGHQPPPGAYPVQPQCPPRGYGQPMMQNGPPSFQVPPSPGMPQAHPAGPYGDPSKTDALQHQGQWAAAIKHSDKAKEAMAKQQYDLGLHKRHQDARKTMPVPTRSGSNQGGLLGITGLPTISGPGVSGLSSKSTKAIEDTSPEGQGCKSGKKQPVADPSKSSSGSGDSNVPSTKYTDQYLLRLLRGPGPLPPSKSNSNGSSQRRTPAPNLSGGNSSSLHSSRSSQASFGRATMHYASVAKETSCQGSPKRLLSGMSSGGPLASRMARPLGPPVIREQKPIPKMPDQMMTPKYVPEQTKGVLGDADFQNVRSLIMKQQEQFLHQVWELHRAHRMQRLITSRQDTAQTSQQAQRRKEEDEATDDQPAGPPSDEPFAVHLKKHSDAGQSKQQQERPETSDKPGPARFWPPQVAAGGYPGSAQAPPTLYYPQGYGGHPSNMGGWPAAPPPQQQQYMQMMHQYYASAGPPRPGGAQGPQVMGGYPAYAYHQQVAKQPSGAYPPGYAYHPHMGHFAASGAKSSSYEAFMDHYAQHCSNGAQRVSVEKSNSPDEPSSKSGEAKPKDNASGSPTEETPSNCRPEETQKTKQWWKDPAQVWGPPGTVPEQTASPKLSRKSHPSAGKPWETATMSGPAKLAMKRRAHSIETLHSSGKKMKSFEVKAKSTSSICSDGSASGAACD